VNALPTERDLPPAAQVELRARVVDAVGRPAPTRRWIPVAAAAALAAVVAGATVAVSVADRGEGAAPAAPPSASSVPAPSTPGPTPSATISLAGKPRVLSLGLKRIAVNATLQTQVERTCNFHAPVRLAVRAWFGTIAAVAPGMDAFGCGFGADGGPAPGGAGSYTGTYPSSPTNSPLRATGFVEAPLAEGLFLSQTQGKVTSAVSRVTLTYQGQTVDAVVGNGVFIGGAQLQYGPARPLPTQAAPSGTVSGMPNPLPEPDIRAYDTDGRLLYRYADTGIQVDDTGRGDVSCARGPGRCRYPWP
jgi:hypothetical protein